MPIEDFLHSMVALKHALADKWNEALLAQGIYLQISCHRHNKIMKVQLNCRVPPGPCLKDCCVPCGIHDSFGSYLLSLTIQIRLEEEEPCKCQ